jgi:hypothetical protein
MSADDPKKRLLGMHTAEVHILEENGEADTTVRPTPPKVRKGFEEMFGIKPPPTPSEKEKPEGQ